MPCMLSFVLGFGVMAWVLLSCGDIPQALFPVSRTVVDLLPGMTMEVGDKQPGHKLAVNITGRATLDM